MQVNIIHDDRITERLANLVNELKVQGIIDYKIWQAVVDKNSAVESINASHKMVVQDAKDKGLKEVCIMEDDAFFPANDGWQFFLKNKPSDFNLYLWGSYAMPLSNNIVNGFQLYIINEKFYDRFLNVPLNVHIDDYMNVIRGDYKYCYPFPCLQRPGFSRNNGAVVNYNIRLSKEDIYQ